MSAGAAARLPVRALIPLLLPFGPRLAAQEPADAYLHSLRANVARVQQGPRTGFGFIVGLGERTVLIATAEHTVKEDDPAQVCFLDMPPESCPAGRVVYRDDPRAPGEPDLDLALIEAPYPDGLPWRPDAMGASAAGGEPAWFIGRNEEWFVPGTPGRILTADAARGALSYAGLPVAVGVSGAPIVVPGGIVGMHTESPGDDGAGILLDAIRTRVERRGSQWVLVPPAVCPADDAARHILANRWVVVRFSWHRAAPAMDAMARLRCAGALTLPIPGWGSAADEREVVYRGGDLRSARVVQTLLSPLGRIETRLGTPGGEVEIILP